MIAVGTRVVLKHCPHGQPGTVVRMERNRTVVLWHDLNYLARHPEGSLTEYEIAVERAKKGAAHQDERAARSVNPFEVCSCPDLTDFPRSAKITDGARNSQNDKGRTAWKT